MASRVVCIPSSDPGGAREPSAGSGSALRAGRVLMTLPPAAADGWMGTAGQAPARSQGKQLPQNTHLCDVDFGHAPALPGPQAPLLPLGVRWLVGAAGDGLAGQAAPGLRGCVGAILVGVGPEALGASQVPWPPKVAHLPHPAPPQQQQWPHTVVPERCQLPEPRAHCLTQSVRGGWPPCVDSKEWRPQPTPPPALTLATGR